MELGALSVSIEDADAETGVEQPIFGEPGDVTPGLWRHNVVTALFGMEAVPEHTLREAEIATGLHHHKFTIEHVAEQDWVRHTRLQFDPIRINSSLWIVPSWHVAPDQDAINIVLDPGLAFGTGSHPTTQLCLLWLAENLRRGESVLDYGCGSGILAIAAKLLGAGETIGVDIDPQAIGASISNAAQNNVDLRFAKPDALSDYRADIIVANILANPLKILAPLLTSMCCKGGRIVLSGILPEQAGEVGAAYSQWFDMQAPTKMENWVLMVGIKR